MDDRHVGDKTSLFSQRQKRQVRNL